MKSRPPGGGRDRDVSRYWLRPCESGGDLAVPGDGSHRNRIHSADDRTFRGLLLSLLTRFACGVPAVDYEFRAGHVRRLIGGEEHHSRGDLLWSCESVTQRGHGLEGVKGRVGQNLDQGSIDAAGMDGIDTDALRRVFDGRGLGQHPDSALAGVIRRYHAGADDAVDRGNVDY